MTDLQRAVHYLSADPYGRGRWVYESWDEGSERRYVVDSVDMRDLGRRLRLGQSDAYSRWCASTFADRV